eukprot:jgi/Chlat1/1725/Chrsp13S02164
MRRRRSTRSKRHRRKLSRRSCCCGFPAKAAFCWRWRLRLRLLPCCASRQMKWRTADCELTAHLLDPHGNAYPKIRINGKRLSYCYTSHLGRPVTFQGWLAAANFSRYKRFIFSPPGEASVTSAGVLAIEAFVEQELGATPAPAPRVDTLFRKRVRKPPVVDVGNKISCSPKTSYQVVRGRCLGSFSLQVETAEVLRLRGVLLSTNPKQGKVVGKVEGKVVAPCATLVRPVKLEAPARRRMCTRDRIHILTGDSNEDDEIEVWTVTKRVKKDQVVEIQ